MHCAKFYQAGVHTFQPYSFLDIMLAWITTSSRTPAPPCLARFLTYRVLPLLSPTWRSSFSKCLSPWTVAQHPRARLPLSHPPLQRSHPQEVSLLSAVTGAHLRHNSTFRCTHIAHKRVYICTPNTLVWVWIHNLGCYRSSIVHNTGVLSWHAHLRRF